MNKASGLFISSVRIQHFQPTMSASAKSLADERDRKRELNPVEETLNDLNKLLKKLGVEDMRAKLQSAVDKCDHRTMEVASSRLDHLQTQSADKTSEHSLLVKLPFWWRSGRCRQCYSDFLPQCAGDIEADHTDSEIAMDCAGHILAIDEAS